MSTITTALLTSNRSIRSGIGNSIDPTGFIVRPYISDIHNGISNPNFTYTGGPTIVPDENGILRRTPAGYPAVEGGRWAATLAEGALLGPELITNEADRTFSSDTGFWIKQTWTISGGTANNNGASGVINKGISTVGSMYLISFEVISLISGTIKPHIGGVDGPEVSTTGLVTYEANASVSIYSGVRSLLFSGSIDNISVREIIPQWLPPTAGTTRSISTRKGLRTIQTADTFEGMLVEPAMTNKCTCRKSNPTDTTGVTGAGRGYGLHECWIPQH